MIHYSSTEARKILSEIISKVKYEKIIVSLGRHDKQEVLIIPRPEITEEIPVSHINASSSSFQFLADEPDIYSLGDLKKRYV